MLRTSPLVAAVRDYYLICVPVNVPVLMKVTVGGRDYLCHSNGIRISNTRVQKFRVPMEVLDKAREYRVTYGFKGISV